MNVLEKLQTGTDLTPHEIKRTMDDILYGRTTTQKTVDFITGLMNKGETDDEILSLLDVLYDHSVRVSSKNAIDVCGTGGDGLQTFNISTAASFVIAASGGVVAKHGNRSSGISGSADIFEYFGYDLYQSPEKISSILEKFNICFMFAQKFHPHMKHIAQARKIIKKRTIFNVLGPLSNPARVKNQLIGVSSGVLLEKLPKLLSKRGANRTMTVMSKNGMDEFSTSSKNMICFMDNNRTITKTIDPIQYGFEKSTIQEIQVSTKQQAITSFIQVLDGTANSAKINTVLLNAAAGLVVYGLCEFEEGIEIVKNTIHSGKAYKLLHTFVKHTGNIQKLEEHKE